MLDADCVEAELEVPDESAEPRSELRASVAILLWFEAEFEPIALLSTLPRIDELAEELEPELDDEPRADERTLARAAPISAFDALELDDPPRRDPRRDAVEDAELEFELVVCLPSIFIIIGASAARIRATLAFDIPVDFAMALSVLSASSSPRR